MEDETLFMEIMEKDLARLGYLVTAEKDCVKALGIFREAPDRFDLVITDQSMPKMTGVELTEEIKKIRRKIPLILCTGFSELLDEKTINELGITGTVMKPVTTGDLAAAVREVLDRGE